MPCATGKKVLYSIPSSQTPARPASYEQSHGDSAGVLGRRTLTSCTAICAAWSSCLAWTACANAESLARSAATGSCDCATCRHVNDHCSSHFEHGQHSTEHVCKVEVPAHCWCCTAAAAAHGWRASAPRQETALRRRRAAHSPPPPTSCDCQPSALVSGTCAQGFWSNQSAGLLYKRRGLLAVLSEARSGYKRALGGGMPQIASAFGSSAGAGVRCTSAAGTAAAHTGGC